MLETYTYVVTDIGQAHSALAVRLSNVCICVCAHLYRWVTYLCICVWVSGVWLYEGVCKRTMSQGTDAGRMGALVRREAWNCP